MLCIAMCCLVVIDVIIDSFKDVLKTGTPMLKVEMYAEVQCWCNCDPRLHYDAFVYGGK